MTTTYYIATAAFATAAFALGLVVGRILAVAALSASNIERKRQRIERELLSARSELASVQEVIDAVPVGECIPGKLVRYRLELRRRIVELQFDLDHCLARLKGATP